MQWIEPKLLIADDDRDFRETLAEVFHRRGYATHLAADGQEALEICHARPQLHLVIFDVHMPRVTGLEALQHLRVHDCWSLPCILMSAQMDDRIVREAQALNPAGILAKPFTLRDLTATVEEALRRSYGWEI
ncbi:MAG: response regulator [Pirellulaceae bacterium]|nr:response regulator [Pirellulaceae bacterium]